MQLNKDLYLYIANILVDRQDNLTLSNMLLIDKTMWRLLSPIMHKAAIQMIQDRMQKYRHIFTLNLYEYYVNKPNFFCEDIKLSTGKTIFIERTSLGWFPKSTNGTLSTDNGLTILTGDYLEYHKQLISKINQATSYIFPDGREIRLNVNIAYAYAPYIDFNEDPTVIHSVEYWEYARKVCDDLSAIYHSLLISLL